jgi:hypothetical protein
MFFIGLICAGLIALFWHHMPWNVERARLVAEKYLKETYTEEMLFRYGEAWMEPQVYAFRYQSKNYPNVWFTVEVSSDFMLCSDDYYAQYFKKAWAGTFDEPVRLLWGDSAKVSVVLDRLVASGLKTSFPELNEQTKLNEVPVKYTISIKILHKLNDKYEEAQKIFSMIQYIQNEGYNPHEIFLRYTDDDDHYELLLFNTSHWPDWNNLTDVSQIITYIDENLHTSI